MKTFSLEEVAAMTLPPEWTDSVRWLARRINRGEIPGYRVGHKLRMTEQHVDAMLNRYSTSTTPAPQRHQIHTAQSEQPMRLVDGLSPRSRRTLTRSA